MNNDPASTYWNQPLEALFAALPSSPVGLSTAAALSILTGEWIDAVIVLVIVVAGAILGFVQKYNASHAVEQFRTGWFVESLFTELFILLVVRTRRSLFKSRPGRYLWVSTLLVGLVTLAIPYLPFAEVLGFVPLPPLTLLLLVAITLLYVVANEIAKRAFYRRAHL